MTAQFPGADEYWASIARAFGVGGWTASVLGGPMQRTVVRHVDGMAGFGVLESLVGSSALEHVDIIGRRCAEDGHAEQFRMTISPAFNTWRARYGDGTSDANHGADGWAIGSETSSAPRPRWHLDHPSTLVYFEKLPIWGGVGHRPGDYLPNSVDVLWPESAQAPPPGSAPHWQPSPTPGEMARIELTCPDAPDADGTAIFDLRHRLRLKYELRHRGERQWGFVVDALRIGDGSDWWECTGDTWP